MNMISAFLKARFASLPEYRQESYNTQKRMLWSVKFTDERIDFKVDESIFPNNTLVVPRAYGANAPVSDARMDYLTRIVLDAYRSPYTVLSEVSRYFTRIEDGGSFWDIFIYRHNGDTPIAICEHMVALNIIASQLITAPPSYIDFIHRAASYVIQYDPAILNNHLSWKALMLVTSGYLTYDNRMICQGEQLYRFALQQVNPDGSMPLELMRGNKAARYTVMNLEALNALEQFFHNQANTDLQAPKNLIEANHDVYEMLFNFEHWKDKYGLSSQATPDRLLDWWWVLRDWDNSGAFNGIPSAKGEIAVGSYINNFRV